MIPYQKINSIYKRDLKGKFTSEYSTPEIEFLADKSWVWTEKIDGTNIRIGWNGNRVEFGGRTDNAQLPTFLYEHLSNVFTSESMIEKLKTNFATVNEDTKVVLYGEGYGRKIQGCGSRYISNGVNFILFDIRVGHVWLTRDAVNDLAHTLDLSLVPTIGSGTLAQAEELVRSGFKSPTAEDSSLEAEGLVLRPGLDLLTRMGNRIITKIKTVDYRRENVKKE